MEIMTPKKRAINAIQNVSKHFGVVVRRASGYFEAGRDIGRNYQDPEGTIPRFILKPMPKVPWAGHVTRFIVDNGSSRLEEDVYYSHLTLLKLCKEFDFDTVLDIGSHERRISRIFEHLGKKLTTCEIAPGYEADYKKDYLDVTFDQPFDAIWCSQIYEHQRNPGLFLDKLFDDLKEGGILALTVPFQVDHHVLFGHLNITPPLMLIYHLICAGFDCSNICLKLYSGNIGVILKKKYNGIARRQPMGLIPVLPSITKEAREKLGNEFFAGMIEAFPPKLRDEVRINYLSAKIESINWPSP